MKKLVLLIIIFGLTVQTHSQDITSKLKEIHTNSKLAGFAVTVIKNGKISYQNTFGYSNIKNKKPYTSKTYQPIGSLSKQVLGIATLKAIELGFFHLETEINEILPFTVVNPHSPENEIKIKHLLTHTSGIIDSEAFYSSCYFIENEPNSYTNLTYLKDSLGFQFGKMIRLDNLLSKYLNKNGSDFDNENFLNQKAGELYEYSNIASALMGYIIEYTSKTSFSEFTKKYIFQPLQMHSTSWNGIGLNINQRATLYLNQTSPLPKYNLASYPDGALNTTNIDFGKFMLEVLNGIRGDSKILDKKSYELLQKDILGYIPKNQSKNKHISCFWFWNENGRNTLYGSDPGLMTMMVIDIENDSGYFILQNMDYDNSQFQSDIENSFGKITSELKKIELN